MKKTILALLSAGFTYGAHAINLDVQCQETGIDHGINLEISATPAAWLGHAEIWRDTGFGQHKLSPTYAVDRIGFPEVGERFKVTSQSAGFALAGRVTGEWNENTRSGEGTLKADVVENGREKKIRIPVRCTIYRNEVQF